MYSVAKLHECELKFHINEFPMNKLCMNIKSKYLSKKVNKNLVLIETSFPSPSDMFVVTLVYIRCTRTMSLILKKHNQT